MLATKKSVLILVKNDPVSKMVERDAKKAGFTGEIVKLSLEQARVQGTPLPLLIKNHESWGPDGLVEYFKSK